MPLQFSINHCYEGHPIPTKALVDSRPNLIPGKKFGPGFISGSGETKLTFVFIGPLLQDSWSHLQDQLKIPRTERFIALEVSPSPENIEH